MKYILRVRYLILITVVVVFGSHATQATDVEAKSRLQRPGGITIEQLVDTQKIRIGWNKVSHAKKYSVQVKKSGVVVASKTTKKLYYKFDDSLLRHGSDYTVRIRAKKTATYKKSAWRKKTYEYADVDNDNDGIADDEDTDDDGDGVLDDADEFPLDEDNDGTPDYDEPIIYSLNITSTGFSEPDITIKVNDYVKWTNKHEAGHTIAALDGSWTSLPLTFGDSHVQQFTEAGMYAYNDPNFSDTYTGTITVTE